MRSICGAILRLQCSLLLEPDWSGSRVNKVNREHVHLQVYVQYYIAHYYMNIGPSSSMLFPSADWGLCQKKPSSHCWNSVGHEDGRLSLFIQVIGRHFWHVQADVSWQRHRQAVPVQRNEMSLLNHVWHRPSFPWPPNEESESGFVLLFDESLNAELQKKQLAFHLRSWDHDWVVSRYFGSSFIGHASADDLMEKFEASATFFKRPWTDQMSIGSFTVCLKNR